MTAPTVNPLDRQDVAAPDSYHPGDDVWVHRNGAWRRGVVQGVGGWALLVDFALPASGRAVDTVRPEYVMPRKAEEETS